MTKFRFKRKKYTVKDSEQFAKMLGYNEQQTEILFKEVPPLVKHWLQVVMNSMPPYERIEWNCRGYLGRKPTHK